MLAPLLAACESFAEVLSRWEPSRATGADCARVVETLAVVEKRCAAARAITAARAVECGAQRDRGFSAPEAWLAQTSGISIGEARSTLAMAEGLADCPQTREALVAGELSLAQAAEITKTERAAPGSETTLIEMAGRSGVGKLRDEGRKRRLESGDIEGHHRRARRERFFRHWQDANGMICVSGAFTPEVGVPLCNRIDTETERLARAARTPSGGDGDEWAQLAADAVAKLVLNGGSSPKKQSSELVLVCDVGAFQRGHTHPGEVCQIIGGGPVPVTAARDVAAEAFIKAVLYRGVQIETVAHFGRHINATLRTALGIGKAPLFEGAVCVEEGCDRRYGLERDHLDPVANHGITSLENLEPRYKPHHREKTERDRQAGLLGPHPPNRSTA